MIAGAVGMGALAFMDPALIANPWYFDAMMSLGLGGISMEAGAIAGALTSNRGMTITTRQAAAFRQVVRGPRRVGGVMVYKSTTGRHHDQVNYVIVIAGHRLSQISGLYLDGRLVYWNTGSTGGSYRNGAWFGGDASGGSHTGPDGVQYNFGGKVYCRAYYGDQLPTDIVDDLNANDPNWGRVNGIFPYGGGCAWVYLKREHDEVLFPNGDPEIKFMVSGKDDIYDPRTGTHGYTDNWALHVADHIRDPLAGFNDRYINEDQLIAAANICDEAVAVASQNTTEKRWVLSASYDTSMSAGSILQKMQDVAAGRVRHIGGEWHIFPGAWRGPSFAFGKESLCGAVQSAPVLGIDELCNRITGTYTAPNYPYNVAGNQYDRNGFYEGQTQNNWPFAWQPTDFPMYARDQLHGYASAQDLNQDSGVQDAWAVGQTWHEDDAVTHNGAIWKSTIDGNTSEPLAGSSSWVNGAQYLSMDLNLDWVISVTQAQRLAKIKLMRSRFQGRYKLPMFLASYSMQPLDVMNMTLPEFGWADKVLEIDMPVLQAVRNDENGPPALQVMVPVAETDPTVYAWSVNEELTVGSAPATPSNRIGAVQPPTNVGLLSSAATAVTQPDGSLTPRIQVNWDTPLDAYVTRILFRYRVTGTTAWVDAGSVDVSNNTGFIAGVVAGQTYDVAIASQRSSGAISVWVEIDGFASGYVLSAQSGDAGIGSGSMVGIGGTAAAVEFQAFSATIGTRNLTYFPGGPQVVTGLQPKTKYYGYVIDPNLTGGDLTGLVTTNPEDFRGKPGYFLIDSVVTPALSSPGGGGGGSGSGPYYPSNSQDTDDRTTQSPTQAFDGDTSTCATVSASYFQGGVYNNEQPDPVISNGGVLFDHFPSILSSSQLALTIDAEVTQFAVGGTASGGFVSIEVRIGGGSVSLLSAGGNTARATYTAPIPANTALSDVTVSISVGAPAVSSNFPSGKNQSAILSAKIYEIFIS